MCYHHVATLQPTEDQCCHSSELQYLSIWKDYNQQLSHAKLSSVICYGDHDHHKCVRECLLKMTVIPFFSLFIFLENDASITSVYLLVGKMLAGCRVNEYCQRKIFRGFTNLWVFWTADRFLCVKNYVCWGNFYSIYLLVNRSVTSHKIRFNKVLFRSMFSFTNCSRSGCKSYYLILSVFTICQTSLLLWIV